MPFVIVIVNSRFLGHVYKSEVAGTSLGPIHRRLTKTKSIGSGHDPESQAVMMSTEMILVCLLVVMILESDEFLCDVI